MKKTGIPRATLGRLPDYLQYIRNNVRSENISAAAIARGLELGEVQVRKDLGCICDSGRPKTGYDTAVLRSAIEETLGMQNLTPAVIVGTGKLGRALLDFDGFSDFGLEIAAGFDADPQKVGLTDGGKQIFPMEELERYCRENGVRIGIITVPVAAAQSVCDRMTACGIDLIWNFSPVSLTVGENVTLKNENLALSLAHLKSMAQ